MNGESSGCRARIIIINTLFLLFSIVREEQATALCLISVWLYLLPIRIEESLEMKFMWKRVLMYEFDKIYSDGKKDGRGNGFSVLTGYEAEPNYPAYTNTKEKLILEDGSQVDVYTKSMFYKFMPSKRKIAELGMSLTPEVTMKDDNDWPVNLPILRLEDMMLMYAELLVEEGKIMEAVAYVNDIRKRAGCDEVNTVSAADALKLIKRERRIELMGEGVRWFDLVRWGEWQTEIQSLFDSYHNPDGTDKNNVKTGRYLYPIPLNQLNVTPGLYKQNEGY